MNRFDKLSALIVDDEKNARAVLAQALEETELVNVIGEASNVPEAVKLIHKTKPSLIFLDIEMPGYSGLQLLEFFNEEDVTFDIIFVTAYNEYAINAFKLSAFDYLLKPIDEEDLRTSLSRYLSKSNRLTSAKQVALLKSLYQEEAVNSKIAVASTYGVEFLEVPEIVYLEAKNNYTEIYLLSNRKVTASKTLSDFESILTPFNLFFRAHRSFLINLNQVQRLSSKDGVFIELKTGTEIPLSRYRRKEFEDHFAKFKI